MCDLFCVSNLKSDLRSKYSIFNYFCIWITQKNLMCKQNIYSIEPATVGVLWKKQFLKISQYSQENTCVGVRDGEGSFVCNWLNKMHFTEIKYLAENIIFWRVNRRCGKESGLHSYLKGYCSCKKCTKIFKK